MTDQSPVPVTSATVLNTTSLVRLALGALAAWLVTHKLLPGSDAASQLVSDLTPVVIASGTALWIFLKNKLDQAKLKTAINAPAPAVPVK